MLKVDYLKNEKIFQSEIKSIYVFQFIKMAWLQNYADDITLSASVIDSANLI